MKTSITPQGLPVRDLTDDEKQFLHYNPNTSDLVEFVQAYAREALAAQAATLESIHKIIECAGPEAADEIADLLGYPSVEWPSDQAASVEPVGEVQWAAGVEGSFREVVFFDPPCPPVGTKLYAGAPPTPASQYTDIVSDGGMDPRNASRQPQAQQGVAAPLELKVCHSQNASQTPQTDLSLMAAPQEWSPAYTRGPSRQSAPVTAVPAMVPLTEEQMVSAVRPLCNTDQVAERLVAVSVDEYRAIEAAIAKINGLTVGDGAQPIKDTP